MPTSSSRPTALCIRELVEQATGLGLEVEHLRVRSPRPVDALLEVAGERQAGLLVFGPDRSRLRPRRFARSRAENPQARVMPAVGGRRRSVGLAARTGGRRRSVRSPPGRLGPRRRSAPRRGRGAPGRAGRQPARSSPSRPPHASTRLAAATSSPGSRCGRPSSSTQLPHVAVSRLERDRHGQRALAPRQVAEHRLAGHGRIAPDPEQVVDRLECQPEVPAECAEGLDDVAAGPCQHRPDRRRALEQRPGLARTHARALVGGDVRAPLEVEILGLAVDQPRGRIRQRLECGGTMGRAGVQEHLERQREHGVARQDRPRAPEHRPRGGPVVALGVAVHDVVVQEREGVHELHRDRAGQAVGGGPAGRPG